MVRRGKLLTPLQRILIRHIFGLSAAMMLTLLGGNWVWLASIVSVAITVSTVARLLVHRSARIIITRSLEPVLLVVFAQLYIGFLQQIFNIEIWQQAALLSGIFVVQFRYLLLQFRAQTAAIQTGFTALLIIITNTVLTLIMYQYAWSGFVVVLAAWLINYIIVHYWLERVGYHNSFLAGVWALVATEMIFISSVSLVFYTIPSTQLVVSRTALFLSVIAYAWGSMLSLHARRQLSKKLVIEYGMICAILLIILLIMNGV